MEPKAKSPTTTPSRASKTTLTTLCTTLALLGSFVLFETTTAVFTVALLACAALVVNTVVAEWTSFGFADRLFGARPATPARAAPPTEPVLQVVPRDEDPDEDTLPHAA